MVDPSKDNAMKEQDKAAPHERTRRKEARPQELIDAGIAEFAERGFAGTRLEDVAKRAGVVKGTIYRYFKDKEALFDAAIRSKAPPGLEMVEQMIEEFTGTTEELLTFFVSQVYSEIVDSETRALVRIILSEGARFPSLAKLYYEATFARGRPILEKVIARGVERGEVYADHARLLPLMLMGPALMASIWKMTFDQFESLPSQDMLDAHLELLRRGVLRPAPAKTSTDVSE
jgi:AcrR family transcriptional regulator